MCREDGFLDFWDYYYRQNEVTFQHKVGLSGLPGWQKDKLACAFETCSAYDLLYATSSDFPQLIGLRRGTCFSCNFLSQVSDVPLWSIAVHGQGEKSAFTCSRFRPRRKHTLDRQTLSSRSQGT